MTANPLKHGGISLFILRRVLVSLVVLFLVSLVVFAATQALGDPAEAILGRNATPESIEALRAELNLNTSVVSQYLHWVRGLFELSLGNSLVSRTPVADLLGGRLVNTGVLVLLAALVSIPLSIAIGAWAAFRREKLFDSASSTLMLVLAALPEFVVAVLLVVLFATTVTHILPAISRVPPGQSPWDRPAGLVLPTITLVFAVTPYVSRIMRASMIEVLESDYIEMARLKGLSERTVLVRHAIPNAIGPVLQVIAINLAYLAGGVIVVEYVFNYPGIGSALQSAVVSRDFPVVQALTMLIATVYIALNTLADVGTILVTPRLRTQL
jgi:peptide/nickel transport system permease protein